MSEEKTNAIELVLMGAGYRISIGKGVIRALGMPSHVSVKVSDTFDSLSVFACDEDNIMAFRVPSKLFKDSRCCMLIHSKQFVHGIMRLNGFDVTKSYLFTGEYLADKNIAVFPLMDGVMLKR